MSLFEIVQVKYVLFFILGLLVGRITMAIEYVLVKEMARSKKKDIINKDNVVK